MTSKNVRENNQIKESDPAGKKLVCILGSDHPLDETCEPVHLIRENGFALYQGVKGPRQADDTRAKDAEVRDREAKAMEEAFLYIAVNPGAREWVKAEAKRREKEFLYMPQSLEDEEIQSLLDSLRRILIRAKYGEAGDISEDRIPDGATIEEQAASSEEEPSARGGQPDSGQNPYEMKITPLSELRQIEKQALREVRRYLGDTPIYIDDLAYPRPVGLAGYLLENGFSVKRIYAASVSPEEEGAYARLKEKHPEVLFLDSARAGEEAAEPAGKGKKKLAIGAKAARLERTPFYVDIFSGDGLWGVDGRVRLLLRIKEAFVKEKG